MAEAAKPRNPESEVYGRSLSTIYRLGAFMVGRSLTEIPGSPEASQARVEFYTSVEEGFGTDVELGGGLEVRDFDERQVINGRVMAKDLKTAVSTMTEAGLLCALETHANDQKFLPQLIRTEHDHANALIVDEMVQGKTTYNTRIVVSPFPEEAAADSGDAYWRKIGYVPHLRRGFVQLYHVTEKGTLLAGSLSFDGSNKQKLLEVFAKHGLDVPQDEITDNWLPYAITDTLSDAHAKVLATSLADQLSDAKYHKTINTVDVTRQYRSIMDQVFDESYVHICESLYRGHQTKSTAQLIHQLTDKAHHFNERYSTVLYRMRANTHQFTDDDSAVLHELLVYSTIEMMRAIHLKQKAESSDTLSRGQHVYADSMANHFQAMDTATFQSTLSSFGAEGARNNRGYSACGLEISAGKGIKGLGDLSDSLKLETGPQSIFGGLDQSDKDSDNYGSLTFTCPKGHTNRRPRGKLVPNCQKCGVDVSCAPSKSETEKTDKIDLWTRKPLKAKSNLIHILS